MGRSAAAIPSDLAPRELSATADTVIYLHPTRGENHDALTSFLTGLQCIGRAAILTDARGEIVGVNPLAKPFVVPLTRPCASRPSVRFVAAGQRIGDIVAAVLRPSCGAEEAAALIDVPGRGRVMVRATDVRAVAPGLFAEPRVLLDFTTLGLDDLPTAAFLRQILGLTTTEAEVALALAGGAATGAIARDRAVSHETIRSHLKTIFAKTCVRRQATLVALVLRLRGVSPSA